MLIAVNDDDDGIGVGNIDYFIGSNLESQESQVSSYSERYLAFPHFACYLPGR
jgi:hypothetical protein